MLSVSYFSYFCLGFVIHVRHFLNNILLMRPYLLISNDDGVNAPGIQFLIDTLRPCADLLVMAPDSARSGYSCSFTAAMPLTYKVLRREEGLTVCSCSGTPADCVKMALNLFPERKPDLVVGGINHGDNSSVNAHYSGTMGVVIEGALQGYPSIAFSLCDFREDADFTPLRPYLIDFVFKTIAMALPPFTCLNVNFPKAAKFRGVKVCRMARSRWQKEVEPCSHPYGGRYYWLAGESVELEPEAIDTDRWALAHDYVAVTPTQLDLTATELVNVLRDLF